MHSIKFHTLSLTYYIFLLQFSMWISILFSENYHYLYSLLSQLKISVLDSQRKEVKQRYNDALAAYVTQYFGRPLEKLNVSTLLRAFCSLFDLTNFTSHCRYFLMEYNLELPAVSKLPKSVIS